MSKLIPAVAGPTGLELRIFAVGVEQVYPLERWRLSSGQDIAIVSEVYGNSGLLGIANRVAEALDADTSGPALLFRLFPTDGSLGGPAGPWEYVWSSGDTHVAADLDGLAALGLDFRS